MSEPRRSWWLVVVAALAGACGDGSALPSSLAVEADWMVAAAPPEGWERARSSRLSGEYFVLEVDGVEVVAAGDFRDAESVRATMVAVAWESPALVGAGAVVDACRDVAAFAARVAPVAFGEQRANLVDVEACVAASVDPDLRDDFVLSFADHVGSTSTGTRSFGAGILRETVNGVTHLRVVTSLSFALAP